MVAALSPDEIEGRRARAPIPISESFSIFLDHLRWISALLVVLGHARQFFFVDYDELLSRSLFWDLFYIVTRLAHQAVLVFFLISGAMIAGRFMTRQGIASFRPADYAISRLTRLWLVLIPTLVLCVLQVAVTPAEMLPEGCQIGTVQLIGNLLFVQEVLVAPLCNNVPLWSLANEFWYYSLAGLAVYALAASSVGSRLVALGLAALLVLTIGSFDGWTEKNVLAYFPIWLLGAVSLHHRARALPLAPAAAIFIATLMLVRGVDIPFYVRDWLFAVATFHLFVAARDAQAGAWFGRLMKLTEPIARTLAGQSYSLYLVHYPVCVALLSASIHFRGGTRLQPDLSGLALMGAVVVASYMLAHVFYLLFERHTLSVRNVVKRTLKGKVQ